MRTLLPYLIGALVLGGLAVSAAAEEPPVLVVLKDGRQVAGPLIREDANTVFIRTEEGEERGIARTRIERVVRGTVRANAPQPQQSGLTPEQQELRKQLLAENRALLEELKDLGDPRRDKRRAAMARVEELGKRAEPLLLGILHPKEKMSVDLRLGALRGLEALGVLSPEGAESLAWVAMKDTDFEVRREACRTIRKLGDERAISYLLKFVVGKHEPSRRLAAWALREIDDVRAVASLVAALPPPQAEVTMPTTGHSTQGEWRELPIGPYGGSYPIHMPKNQPMVGSGPVGHPASDALKLIAGKDLGSHPLAWLYWFRQKIGTMSREDARKHYRDRSLRSRMNAP